MTFSPVTFYLVAAFVVVCALGVVLFKQLIYSALSMMVCFMAVAGIYILLHAELLAAAQVLIYVGAISILIIFAIMLTRHRKGDTWLFFHRQALVAAPILVVGGAVVTVVLSTAGYHSVSRGQNPSDQAIARIIFNDYAFPFEMVSLVLLVAMIGAVLLAKRERRR